MRRRSTGGTALVLSALAAAGLVACGGNDGAGGGGSGDAAKAKGSGAAKAAALLPDSKSSSRWELVDRPFLKRAFEAKGVQLQVLNAEGDKSTQQQQAEQAITNGAKVLLLVNLDPGSGAAIAANAKSHGVKVIDYDRLTVGGDSDYYVSFDNEKVGELQGQGLLQCLDGAGVSKPRIALVNGSPTDNNAALLKKGAATVLKPHYADGSVVKVAEQDVPDWDNQKALTLFEQMLQKTGNRIDGVVAANDGIANSVVSALKARKLKPIPVTGGDATAQAITNIVNGDQCMTVYKAIKKEAEAAADIGAPLAKGQAPQGVTDRVDNGKGQIPAVLLQADMVTRDTVKQFIGQPDFPKRAEICAGKTAAACRKAGL